MWSKVRLPKLSVKAKLILSYLIILGIGGLVTSIVGSWTVSSTIMQQARRKVDHDLATALTIYEQQLQSLERTVELTASGTTIRDYFSPFDSSSLLAYLDPIHKNTGVDFLTLTDRRGRVILRTTQPDSVNDDVSSISVVAAAMSGQVAAATEIITAEQLSKEEPGLPKRAYFRFVETPRAKALDKTEETSGMVLLAAAPVRSARGTILGVLYGGVLLNRNFSIVDGVWNLIYKGERFKDQDVGTVTIFQNDLRISTNVRRKNGERALGTRVSEEVYDAVLLRGETWKGRAFVVNDWYISAYEPIRNHEGETIGILYVGLLEKAYTSIRDRLIMTFFGIALVGFASIIGITYYIIHTITRPIGEMVTATRNIAAGRLDQEVRSTSNDEIGQLAVSFNSMLASLREMRRDLEEWGLILEKKVAERTQELVAMKATVAQAERLASIGQLAAGVAHEINNPLGGILSLTSLTLEDMEKDHPDRENLEEVVRQTERCRDIVKGLLEFSRQWEGKTEPVSINKVLGSTLSLVEKQALFLNIRVVKDWDPQLPAVMADMSQLQQVFVNIIMNAVQAMDETGTITITTRSNSSMGCVEVLVSDTGCGIPPENIDRIFDPFFSTKGSGRGTGLGLSVAYGIVTGHGGTISVESEVGKGSTFIVRIPVLSGAHEEGRA